MLWILIWETTFYETGKPNLVSFGSLSIHYYFYPYFCVMIEMDRITCILGTVK